jgi:hypothetical protein
MRDLVYVVAVNRKDGKLPTSEKIAESRFFAEMRDAQKCADYYNSLATLGGWVVYPAIIEITHDSPAQN